jgi:hypothetical protein
MDQISVQVSQPPRYTEPQFKHKQNPNFTQKLPMDQISVQSIRLQQLIVGSRLNQLAPVDDQNSIRALNGRQSMGYQNYSMTDESLMEGLLD